MHFRIDLLGVCTLLLIGLTVWVITARFRGRLESNWPLVYYALLLIHWKVFESGFSPYWVFGGVVSAVLLRFEFMGGPVLTFVRVVELTFLGYVIVRALQLIYLWPW